MSLYNYTKNGSGHQESWTNYDMESFETRDIAEKKYDNGFIPLQTGEIEKTDFLPLEGYESSRNKRNKGNDTIEKVQGKLSLIEQEAYEKSFAQGEKDGFEFGEKKAIKVIENIENLFNEMSSLKKEILKRHEKEILDLIFIIVEKIIHYRTSSVEGIVKEAVLNALNLVVEKNKIILNVNPEDYDYVDKLRPELFKKHKELKSITVTSDLSISRGGCFLETPYGDVDAGIETQLEKIYQYLQDPLNEKEDD